MSNLKTKRITLLIFAGVFLPVLGYFLAVDIEGSMYSPMGALLGWSILSGLGLCCLYIANHYARRFYDFKSLGPIVFVAFLGYVGAFGWIANSATHNYYFFSDYIHQEYSIQQNDDHLNHFVFQGDIEKGSANAVIRKILSAEGLDWDIPVVIELNSDGGMPQEAIVLAEFISHYDINIEVVGKCFSACSLLLLSSKSRYVHPRAWIGFHGAYMKNNDGSPSYDSPHLRFYDEYIDRQLTQVGASKDFRLRAKVQSAVGGFYPSYKELFEEGVINQLNRHFLSEKDAPFYL